VIIAANIATVRLTLEQPGTRQKTTVRAIAVSSVGV